MRSLTKLGASHARALLGLSFKSAAASAEATAAPETEPPAAPGWSTGEKVRAGAVGLAAASPFAGLIGEQKLIHDPHQGGGGRSYKSFQELQRLAQPGDVVITTKPSGSIWKNFIAPGAGTEFYHAQPIVGRRGGRGLSGTAGDFRDPSFANDTPKQIRESAKTLQDSMKAEGYQGGILLRPKNMTDAQKAQAALNNLERLKQPYDDSTPARLLMKDLFMPKIPGITDAGVKTTCEGNVCSTLPAMAAYDATAGTHGVVPGKAPRDVFPTDFLRSNEYEAVGHTMPDSIRKLSPEWLRARKYMVRAGLGAGLAAGTYAATDDPAITAAGLGGFAAYKGMAHAVNKFHPSVVGKAPEAASAAAEKVFPGAFSVMEALMDRRMRARGSVFKRTALRTIPTVAAGSLAAYLGTRGLQHLYNKYDTPDGA